MQVKRRIEERYCSWLTRRYGHAGRPKARWAWLVECVLLWNRPRHGQRRVFYGRPFG